MPVVLTVLLAAVSPLPLPRPSTPPPVAQSAQPIRTRLTSDDGQWTVMLFGQPAAPGREPDDTLWLQSETSLELTCLFGRECSFPDRQAWGIGTPTFGIDNREIYFVATFYVHDTADLYRLNLATLELYHLGEGASAMVVRDGPYRGDLIVRRRTACAQDGCSYSPAFLTDPDGQTVQRIPDVHPQADGEESAKAWLAANGWQAW